MAKPGDSMYQPDLAQFAQDMASTYPELRQVLDQAKAGDLSEEDALRAMLEIMSADPEMHRQFQDMAQKMYADIAAQMEAADPGFKARWLQQAVQDIAGTSPHPDHDGLVIHKPRGLAQLNPLVEAAIIERAQFDGDIPEMRTGGLTPGVAPAVSLETRVRTPAALGMMLAEASKQIADKITAAEPERQRIVAAVAEGADPTALALIEQTGTGLLTVDEARDRVLDGKVAALDPPEYRRGQVPAPVLVQPPSGSALLALTPQERKQGAWQFLSTTHGRRSAVAGITELVEVKLRGEGFEVRVRPFEPGAREPVLAAHEWTVGIDGAGATQAAFSLIDVAAASITKGLTSKMGERRGGVILEVTTINTVDVRSVGWAGRLLSQDAALPQGN